jgi:trans-2,3-dihydro-3-hydroxyanthranilate isomerase
MPPSLRSGDATQGEAWLMNRQYAILDVFTDTPLAGNQLAVVLDADDLDDDRMQKIAAEFNLAETVFVFPPANPVHRVAIRIFTPVYELPFAGHPTVGTAVLLALDSPGGKSIGHEAMLVLEEKVGPVRCIVETKGEGTGHAIFDLPRLPDDAGEAPSRETLAEGLGLIPSEIGFENHQPSFFSAGVPYIFVPVRDLATMAKLRVNPAAFPAQQDERPSAIYAYCRETEGGGRHFHARMFWPAAGIVEDPATGSAVAAFAGAIWRFDAPVAGSHHFIIEQGFEMGRPSLIGLEIDIEHGAIARARISGDAVVVGRGSLSL